jgi:putative PIN family toxin of toxin-antitoxin system
LIVVFDSGVWISAFHFGGTPLAALRTAHIKHQIATCDLILFEIRKALRQKFGWATDPIEDALADYLDEAIRIPITESLTGICRDPKDDMVFECAILAGASLIVAGDKDLLAVEIYEGIRVLTPRDFLRQLESPAP